MSDDRGLRVRPWSPWSDDQPTGEPAGGAQPTGEPADGAKPARDAAAGAQPARDAADGEPRNWWDNLPDPWDLPYQHSDTPTDELPVVAGSRRRRRRRRSGRATSARRASVLAVAVVAVGAVLVGTGTLASLLASEPTALPAPPTTPPERLLGTSSPQDEPRLGAAPTDGPGRSASRAQAAPPQTRPSPTPPSSPAPVPTSTPSATPVTSSYEAEEAQLAGSAQVYDEPAASGGAAVTGVGMLRTGYVEFPEVRVDEAGEYELTFHYLTSRDRQGEFRVNGGERVAMRFPEPADGPVGLVTVTVQLTAGDNRIWFGYSGIRGPDLDRITVTG